jgi:signal transduction histidine kinase/ActR/RegA family two-component response regulator
MTSKPAISQSFFENATLPLHTLDADKTSLRAHLTELDTTDRKLALQAMEFLATATTTLAALTDHESALSHAVRISVPFIADWCVVYVANERGVIEPHAFAHRDPEQEPRLAAMLAKYPLDWNSPTATVKALRTGTSQLMEELPDTLLAHIAQDEEQLGTIRGLGPRSVISVPLRIRERIIGAMSFVVAAPRSYTQCDLKFAENIADRTAIAIDNAQLFQAVKQASRQKDEFLAMLAHELRNPLAAIRYAGALGRISPGEQQERFWEIIERQTQNLTRLIDDLLDVSRISRDKVTLRKEPIDMAVIVERALATVRPLVEEKRHRLTVAVSDQPMPLVADPTRAEQIIANLLTNAAKYTPEEGRLAVRAFPHDSQAVVEVVDSGVGLPREMLPRVFDLFAQADRTLDRSQGGLGIGLTVARKLAEMHGGTVSAASAGLGHGSTFTLSMPLCETHAASCAKPGQQAASAESRSMRILVVDDNRDTALGGALLLEALGHEVETAFDGPTAIELARSFQPQAILLDIGLPGMTGYEVARRLRNDGFQNAKIIAVSGYGQPDDRRRSREAGFDHHLVKPVDQATLEGVLTADAAAC